MTDLNRKPIFNTDELSEFTGISKSTIYKFTSQKMIPHYVRGKFLYFDKKEIIKWMKEHKVSVIKGDDDPPGGITIVE